MYKYGCGGRHRNESRCKQQHHGEAARALEVLAFACPNLLHRAFRSHRGPSGAVHGGDLLTLCQKHRHARSREANFLNRGALHRACRNDGVHVV